MEAKKILEADYLDIVFDRRNKNYGGYELRKNYDRRVIKSVVLLISVTAIFGGLSAFVRPHGTDLVARQWRDTLLYVEPLLTRKIITPPPPPPATRAKVTTHFVLQVANNDHVDDVPKPLVSGSDNQPTGIGLDTTSGPETGGTIEDRPQPFKPLVEPEKIRTFVQQMPQFIGDINAYLASNLRYPELARSTGIEGKVLLQFIVNEDGMITDVKAMRGIGGGCNEEAVRVVSGMPKWKPGKQNGIGVKVLFTLLIKFELN